MDLIKELGELAMGSRLRRLSDHLMQEGARIYAAAKVPFEPRWFPVFVHLHRRGASAVTDIARDLGISHAAVNQTAGELAKAGLAESHKSTSDRRKRLLKLSEQGEALAQRLTGIWEDIRGALREIISDSGFDLLGTIEAVERAIEERGFCERFESRLKQRQRSAVRIVPFERGSVTHRQAFYDLNEAWVVDLFGGLEAADLKLMEKPEALILDRGGEIFFAKDDESGELLGCCAFYQRLEDGQWELTKMTVKKEARGRQIGRLLGEAVIDHARKQGIKQIMLETVSILTPALTLYRRLGFVAVAMETPSDYVRADIRMVLELD